MSIINKELLTKKMTIELMLKYKDYSEYLIDNAIIFNQIESDLIRVNQSGYLYEYELKTNYDNFLYDFNKTCKINPKDKDKFELYDVSITKENDYKWYAYKHDRIKSGELGLKGFSFVAPLNVIPHNEIPEYSGLIEYDHIKNKLITTKKAPEINYFRPIDRELEERIISNYMRRYTSCKIKLLNQEIL